MINFLRSYFNDYTNHKYIFIVTLRSSDIFFSDTIVALRRVQVSQLRSGTVPCIGDTLHAKLRTGTVRSGRGYGRAKISNLLRSTSSSSFNLIVAKPRGSTVGTINPNYGQVWIRTRRETIERHVGYAGHRLRRKYRRH